MAPPQGCDKFRNVDSSNLRRRSSSNIDSTIEIKMPTASASEEEARSVHDDLPAQEAESISTDNRFMTEGLGSSKSPTYSADSGKSVLDPASPTVTVLQFENEVQNPDPTVLEMSADTATPSVLTHTQDPEPVTRASIAHWIRKPATRLMSQIEDVLPELLPQISLAHLRIPRTAPRGRRTSHVSSRGHSDATSSTTARRCRSTSLATTSPLSIDTSTVLSGTVTMQHTEEPDAVSRFFEDCSIRENGAEFLPSNEQSQTPQKPGHIPKSRSTNLNMVAPNIFIDSEDTGNALKLRRDQYSIPTSTSSVFDSPVEDNAQFSFFCEETLCTATFQDDTVYTESTYRIVSEILRDYCRCCVAAPSHCTCEGFFDLYPSTQNLEEFCACNLEQFEKERLEVELCALSYSCAEMLFEARRFLFAQERCTYHVKCNPEACIDVSLMASKAVSDEVIVELENHEQSKDCSSTRIVPSEELVELTAQAPTSISQDVYYQFETTAGDFNEATIFWKVQKVVEKISKYSLNASTTENLQYSEDSALDLQVIHPGCNFSATVVTRAPGSSKNLYSITLTTQCYQNELPLLCFHSEEKAKAKAQQLEEQKEQQQVAIVGTTLAKRAGCREILVTCAYETERTARRKKMLCRIPHFVLYDTPDQDSSQVIRIIFAYAGVPYDFREVTEDLLAEFPLRTVPVLELDGVKIGNTTSICRHLGWRYDLSGQTALDDSLVDMIAETVHEARGKLRQWLDHIEYRNVDYSKPECSDAYAVEYLDGYLAPIIENILRKSPSPWLIGHKITWADLMVATFFNPIIYHRPDFFHSYPNIYLHNKKIAELEQLEGMLYCVRDRTVDISILRHVTAPVTEKTTTTATAPPSAAATTLAA